MRIAHACCLTLALSVAGPARADEAAAKTSPWSRGGIFLGGYLTRIDSTVRLGSDAAGAALEINLEDAFGLDTSSRDVRAGAFWRLGETMRHRISLEYFGSTRSASKTLEQDITVGGTTFPEGTTVSSKTTLKIIKVSYEWSFFLDDRIDLAASFGIYTMPFSFSFQGISSNEKEDFTAPLPVLGLHASFAIKPNLFLRQRVDVFYLEYGNFSGGLADVYLGVEWYPWTHFGVGLGYENFRIGVQAEGTDYPEMDLRGNVKYQQTGLFGYVTYAF